MSSFIAKTRKAFMAAGSAGFTAFIAKGGALDKSTAIEVVGSAIVAFFLVYFIPNAK